MSGGCWSTSSSAIRSAISSRRFTTATATTTPIPSIALALNADTPTELAALCPFVSEVYPVRIDVFDAGQDLASLDAIPTGWRWVVDDARGHLGNMRQVFPGLASYYDRARARFASLGSQAGVAGEAPPASRPRARSPVSDFRPW